MIDMDRFTFTFFGIDPGEITDGMIREVPTHRRQVLVHRIRRSPHPVAWRALAGFVKDFV
jgi:hypothetical protein